MNTDLKKSLGGTFGLVLILVAVIVLRAAAFVVDEGEQALILQFGRPVGEAITSPGLHFKTPFIQEVRRYEKRLLSWDGDPNQIPTRGREFISIDTTARWRIVDPLRFLMSVRDESGAQARLDDIIDSAVRDRISSTELTEIVRSKDWSVSEEDLEQVDVVQPEDESVALTEEITMGRNMLTRKILEMASEGLPEQIGVELVDVRIKRLNYIPSVREQVFQRMISERQRMAAQFQSEGQGEASRITGDTARQLADIRSEARRRAEVVRGEADAEATRIYNEAFAGDPEFYALLRTLESYPRTLGEKTELILSTETEYFRVLKDQSP